MTIAPAGLAPRRCHLRESDHKYVDETTGEEMAISVTGVTSFFKEPYSGPPDASWRGTHVHRLLQAKAMGWELPDPVSPEGIDCSAWFEQATNGVISKQSGLTMADFWKEVEVIGAEVTFVNTRKSLGGQADLICGYRGKTWLLDYKTKGPSWKGAHKDDLLSYSQQAGGYLELLQSGDDAHSPPWIDLCRTLVITPNSVKWLSAMQPDDCSTDWQTAWGSYAAAIKTTF